MLQGGDLRQALQGPLAASLTWYNKGGKLALDVIKGLHFLHCNRVSFCTLPIYRATHEPALFHTLSRFVLRGLEVLFLTRHSCSPEWHCSYAFVLGPSLQLILEILSVLVASMTVTVTVTVNSITIITITTTRTISSRY